MLGCRLACKSLLLAQGQHGTDVCVLGCGCKFCSLPGAPGQEVAPVSLRLNYYLSRFSEHPWMVPPPRAMATAKSFLGTRPFSVAGEGAFALCHTEKGRDSSQKPSRPGDAGWSLQQQRYHETSPCSPVSHPEIQKQGMASPAGS